VEIDDVPGSLAKLMEIVQVSNVNIEYLYATLENKSGKAVVIFRMENHEQGLKLIRESGLTLIESF